MYITKQINVPKTSHLEKSLVVTVFLPGSLFFSAMDVWRFKEGPHRHWPETQHLDVTWGPLKISEKKMSVTLQYGQLRLNSRIPMMVTLW